MNKTTFTWIAALLLVGCSGEGLDSDTNGDTTTDGTTATTGETTTTTGETTTTTGDTTTTTGEPTTTTTGEPTTTTGDTTTTTGEPPVVPMLLTVRDLFTSDLIVGAEIEADSSTYFSDEEGKVKFSLPVDNTYTIIATEPGYLDLHLHYTVADVGRNGPMQLLSEETKDLISNALGIPVDPQKAIVQINVTERVGKTYPELAGATVTLSSNYDIALASDTSNPLMVTPGTTTLENSAGNIYFINVEPGPLTVTVEPPMGDLSGCSWALAATPFEDWEPLATAGVLNTASVICE